MRLIPTGLGVVAALQVVAAAAAYPILTLAIGLASSLVRTATSPDGSRAVLIFAALPMAVGVVVTAGVFVAVPLGVCIAGALMLGRLARRRGAAVSLGQSLKFAAAVVLANVVVMVAGVLLWPIWWYSEKLAGLTPLWPLLAGFAANALLDAVVAAVILRAQSRAGPAV
ncbi:MAG TPA: hypothetical protein VMI34_15370 [Candidatus Bathyarchaeia archaeon]|nr:hypothetical protein [Candidatus Bathyarchaeia archaeon]